MQDKQRKKNRETIIQDKDNKKVSFLLNQYIYFSYNKKENIYPISYI